MICGNVEARIVPAKTQRVEGNRRRALSAAQRSEDPDLTSCGEEIRGGAELAPACQGGLLGSRANQAHRGVREHFPRFGGEFAAVGERGLVTAPQERLL